MKFRLSLVLGVIVTIAVVVGNNYLLTGEVQAAIWLGLAVFGFFSLVAVSIAGGLDELRVFGDFWGGIWGGAITALLCAFIFFLSKDDPTVQKFIVRIGW
jgi:hypothetical protein